MTIRAGKFLAEKWQQCGNELDIMLKRNEAITDKYVKYGTEFGQQSEQFLVVKAQLEQANAQTLKKEIECAQLEADTMVEVYGLDKAIGQFKQYSDVQHQLALSRLYEKKRRLDNDHELPDNMIMAAETHRSSVNGKSDSVTDEQHAIRRRN